MEIEKTFLAEHQLSQKSAQQLLSLGEIKVVNKNETIIHEGRIETFSYLILEGCAKAHLNHDGKNINFWFGFEGDFLFSYNSKISNQPGYENISTLERCRLWRISNNELENLNRSNLEIANWSRKLTELELVKTEKRLIDFQTKSATARYQDLINRHPEILNRISLGNIASFLGISQVSLSRIRGQY
ncbi:Crp/Fnr family transcriptional regulator [Echinicola shivajiensis]|uniref:Crp/Fnr family transcriptional regulator n=1 Tax=Echinicola shivajiensis TaxID=1035916 RepID=UPI001BFC2054|nr:Crp/Fnr family transcriptional regulator [Echinicola shivajiensis]